MFSFSTNLLKTALFKASFFVMMAVGALCLWGCGDLTEGDPAADGARFRRTFRYYFSQDCRFDNFGVYDCEAAQPLSPAYVVSLRVDSDGLASLNMDGVGYYYLEREYREGVDNYGGPYFMFYEDDGELTLYKDGYEMIFWDLVLNRATRYLYELYVD